MIHLSKANLAAQLCVRDDSRPVLGTICCTPKEGTASADGFKLIVVPYQHEQPGDQEEYILLPRDLAAKALKAWPKVDHGQPAVLSQNEEEVSVTLPDGLRLATPVVEGRFPSYQYVIPQTGPPPMQVGLALDELLEMLKALKAAGVEKAAFSFWKHNTPVRIDALDTDLPVIAVIMPLELNRCHGWRFWADPAPEPEPPAEPEPEEEEPPVDVESLPAEPPPRPGARLELTADSFLSLLDPDDAREYSWLRRYRIIEISPDGAVYGINGSQEEIWPPGTLDYQTVREAIMPF